MADVEIVHTETPPAVTAAKEERRSGRRTATHDPMWDSRRRRLDVSLTASLGLVLWSMWLGPSMANIVIPPAFIFAGGIIGAYFGVAEWGRINGVVSGSSELRGGDNLGNPR